jgi:hypothetical protein
MPKVVCAQAIFIGLIYTLLIDLFPVQAIIPLGSDTALRDRYLTVFGGVRVGRLLEDMDVFAVHLVFKHMLISGSDPDNPQSPFSIVTALVDSIDIREIESAWPALIDFFYKVGLRLYVLILLSKLSQR